MINPRLGLTYDEAPAHVQKLLNNRGPGLSLTQLGYIYAKQGRRAEALKIHNEMEKVSKQGYIRPAGLVRVIAALGCKDQVFVWIRKAYEERDPYLRMIYS